MKSRRAANKTGVAARLRVPKRSRSTSSSASYASVSYIDSLSPDEYVQHLEKTREALRRFPEVPRSRSSSPAIAEPQGKKKGKPAPPSLQDAVRTFIRASKGNPTYGGWHKLTTLLRTSTSIGKPTYIIRRSSLVPAEPPENGWPKMFKTPEESEAWLARREAERKIKAWQLSIERDTAARPSKAPCRISNFDVSVRHCAMPINALTHYVSLFVYFHHIVYSVLPPALLPQFAGHYLNTETGRSSQSPTQTITHTPPSSTSGALTAGRTLT